MQPLLFAVIGNEGVGKTTVMDYLMTRHRFLNYEVTKPMKEMCLVLGAPYLSIYGDSAQTAKLIPELGPAISGRSLMEMVNLGLFRQFSENACARFLPEYGPANIWVKLMVQFVEKVRSEKTKKNLVVGEIHYQDEINALEKYPVRFLHIVRPGVTQPAGAPCLDNLEFSSEIIRIVNDGSIADLHAKIDQVLLAETPLGVPL